MFLNEQGAHAVHTILQNFKRLSYFPKTLDLRMKSGDNEKVKRLKQKIEFLLKINHSGARVLMPEAKETALSLRTKKEGAATSTSVTAIAVGTKKQGTDTSSTHPDRNDHLPGLPLSIWPLVLEKAWKEIHFYPYGPRGQPQKSIYSDNPESQPDATSIFYLLRPTPDSIGPFLVPRIEESASSTLRHAKQQKTGDN